MPLRCSLLGTLLHSFITGKPFGAKLRDVFACILLWGSACASHHPAALCKLFPGLLVPFKAFVF